MSFPLLLYSSLFAAFAAAAATHLVFTAIPSEAFLLPRSSSSRSSHPYNHAGSTSSSFVIVHNSDGSATTIAEDSNNNDDENKKKKQSVVIIGAGWGGLSVAHTLSSQTDVPMDITVIDAAPSVGGLVRDGYKTINGVVNKAEAGQHGFWDNYYNIFNLLENEIESINVDDDVLTGYAEQGQYSPSGLEAVWPVYRNQIPQLPTGLAQGLYTKFMNLPVIDRISAAPLVLAFSEFDDTDPDSWLKYDDVSFKDLCIKLGVSRRCYEEAFEPMILTGLFAPGAECSAAAALGMAYFFVLKSQNSFDVRWCKGNIGKKIFQPWVEQMSMNDDGNKNSKQQQPVKFMMSTRVVGFETEQSIKDDGSINIANNNIITKVICKTTTNEGNDDTDVKNSSSIDCDTVVFAVGGAALNAFVRNSPNVLARYGEFRQFSNLRGTGVLATRIYLDKFLKVPYSANACWGFDEGVGMTFFDITTLHNIKQDDGNTKDDNIQGSIIEVDYYHAASLLVMDDEMIIEKVKQDLNTILGEQCVKSNVIDAAIVRLPQAVNWYSPGSYKNMPKIQSESIPNVYFAGDIVKTKHGSWSQEKAYVTGKEAANIILNRNINDGIIPLDPDEFHVALGKKGVSTIQNVIQQLLDATTTSSGNNDNDDDGDSSSSSSKRSQPSLVDFLW